MKHVSAIASHPFEDYVENMLAPGDVHEAERVSTASAGNGMFIVAALILTVLHGIILYLFLGTSTWPGVPLMLHLALSTVTGLIAYTQYRRGVDAHYLALLAILASVAGVLGTLGTLLGFIASLIFRARAYNFSEWYETIFPTDPISEPQAVYDSIAEGLDENPTPYPVMPFTDVMRIGSENQKRRALAAMSSRFSPKFASAFRSALKDSNNTIRVQAATAVAKVEREFTRKLERIEQARALQPNDPVLTLALAHFYDDYAFTGILDPELEKLNRERAIVAYKAYLEKDPNSQAAWTAVGRLLFRSEQWTQAADWLKGAFDRGWKSPGLVLWYFESLYRLGQYRELRRSILELGRGVVSHDDLPTNVRDSVNLWMQVA